MGVVLSFHLVFEYGLNAVSFLKVHTDMRKFFSVVLQAAFAVAGF